MRERRTCVPHSSRSALAEANCLDATAFRATYAPAHKKAAA